MRSSAIPPLWVGNGPLNWGGGPSLREAKGNQPRGGSFFNFRCVCVCFVCVSFVKIK